MLEGWNIDGKDLFDVIREIDLLDLDTTAKISMSMHPSEKGRQNAPERLGLCYAWMVDYHLRIRFIKKRSQSLNRMKYQFAIPPHPQNTHPISLIQRLAHHVLVVDNQTIER
jgi:hypothetical protein